MLTRLNVVTISQYIQILNHYAVHLKLIQFYVNYTSIKKAKRGGESFLRTKNKKISYCYRNLGFYSFHILHKEHRRNSSRDSEGNLN